MAKAVVSPGFGNLFLKIPDRAAVTIADVVGKEKPAPEIQLWRMRKHLNKPLAHTSNRTCCYHCQNKAHFRSLNVSQFLII